SSNTQPLSTDRHQAEYLLTKRLSFAPHVDIVGATRFVPKERHDSFLRLNIEYNPHPSRVRAGN
ncbi:hypothetical protein, partial [Comamonas testosteroni]|uniref:hypothetical protein n=1 Tax=Comamonas testosteroni TaxID=285 RepID=UPI001E5227DA